MAKVLIVDDSSLGRKLVKRVLLKAGHEVIAEAENGEQGIAEYKRVKPDIVTMDVDMPGISGLEAGKRILQEHPEAKVIVVSAHEQNDLKDEMAKYGLKYYIIKPVTDENVREAFKMITKIPNNIQDNTATEVEVPGLKASVSHHSAIDIIKGVKKLEEGRTLLLEFTRETPLNEFMEEDSIVVSYESEGTYIISQSEISYVDTMNRCLKAEIINSSPLEFDDLFQNLPVSMYVDLKIIGTIKRFPAIISSFMLNEIVFRSVVDFEINEKLSFDVFHQNRLISIEGKITSKDFKRKNTEYILKLDFDDYNIKKAYVSYLEDSASSIKKSMIGALI